MASVAVSAVALAAAAFPTVREAAGKRSKLILATLAVGGCYHLLWRRIAPGNPEAAFSRDGSVVGSFSRDVTGPPAEHAKVGPLVVRRVRASAAAAVAGKRRSCSIVLVHGMWHSSWYFRELQRILAHEGFDSYAVELNPGPLRRWSDFNRDLAATLEALGLERPCILLGHSQGGILVQTLLTDAARCARLHVAGVVLCGTMPLSPMAVAAKALAKGSVAPQKKTIVGELGMLGTAYYMFFGRIPGAAAMKRIFFLPTTSTTSVCPGGMDEYTKRTLSAPSDGWPTAEHMAGRTPDFSHLSEVPVLAISANEDVIYHHSSILPIWKEYFPHMQHHVAERQAHCFADPGWEDSFAAPLVTFLEKCDLNFADSRGKHTNASGPVGGGASKSD
eukprot:INCI6528.2.p1 GENE.INCI6528.2~~INCI6528.2.p1  ORF type:complete len:390 (-),score=61.13 INCI6528.2:283-1452(-)